MKSKDEIAAEGKREQEHGKSPSQHDGGVGNLQDEPKTAEEAKKRAAEEGKKAR